MFSLDVHVHLTLTAQKKKVSWVREGLYNLVTWYQNECLINASENSLQVYGMCPCSSCLSSIPRGGHTLCIAHSPSLLVHRIYI